MPKLMEDYFVGRECSRRQVETRDWPGWCTGRRAVGRDFKDGVMVWHLT